MAQSPESSGDAPKPASIPDLKKAQENKPEAFAWSPGAPIARAAASASLGAPGRARPPTVLERLTSTRGKLATLAVLMLLGGAGLSLTVLPDGTIGGNGGALGGIKSTIKFQTARGRDSTGFTKGGDAPQANEMNFGLIKKGDKLPVAGEIPAIPGIPGAESGDAPMNYDEGATSRGSGVAAGGAAGAATDGAADGGDGGGSGAGVAPKLSSSYGQIKFQGMRRVSGTAGFRGIKGRADTLNKKIQTRGAATNATADTGDVAAGSSRGPALTPFSGNNRRDAGGGAAGKGAAGGAAGGGGGGGGGAEMDPGDIEKDVNEAKASVPDMIAKAASLRKDADKEEKKAKILAAAGQFPQAHYHYDRAKKKEKEADRLEQKASQQIDAIKDQAAGLTETATPR